MLSLFEGSVCSNFLATKSDMVNRRVKFLIKCSVALTLLSWGYFAWYSNGIQLLVWGCGPFTARRQCVFAVRTTETTSIFINRAPPRKPAWCTRNNHGSSGGIHHSACREMQRSGSFKGMAELRDDAAVREMATSLDLVNGGGRERPGGVGGTGGSGGGMVAARRTCVEWLYACDSSSSRSKNRWGASNVTIWYHHFHKAGGSTFVKLAQANGANLMPANSNGNPLGGDGKRIPFWEFGPAEQVAWAADVQRRHGTDFVVTEFGFPGPLSLLAPLPFLYVTILREPVSRLVSNFFWRYRRYFSGQPEPRLPIGQPPEFKEFADLHVDFYVHTLTGEPQGKKLGPEHLAAAQRSLSAFSLVLVCEWLASSSPVLAKHLGWAITDFDAFHEKENGGLKDYGLVKAAFGNDWRAALASPSHNALDVALYAHAKTLAAQQLRRVGATPPSPFPAPPAHASSSVVDDGASVVAGGVEVMAKKIKRAP
mmetsp:Transcript_56690/g.111966  ORF Transcript_56690/g.111966 Transcript_56690/m.111966 type:complete len:482 (+) Transcript_56690:135-1580(+)